MAPPVLPEDQLLELLTQLQKTTPDQARTILSAQPQIAYALMALMVKLDVVDIEVLQKTLSSAALPAASPVPSIPQPAAATMPAYLMQSQYRTSTPLSHSTPPAAMQAPAPPSMSQGGTNGRPGPTPTYDGAPHGYGSNTASGMPDPLSSIPEEQKAIIMRVIAMTPDQINRLPLNERANIVQLRAMVGLTT